MQEMQRVQIKAHIHQLGRTNAEDTTDKELTGLSTIPWSLGVSFFTWYYDQDTLRNCGLPLVFYFRQNLFHENVRKKSSIEF